MDGIITTFAVVAGARGGGYTTEIVLVLGFSSLFADALSMGMGDALSTKAQNEYILLEREREKWEVENNIEGEIQEMVDIYQKKGMNQDDARKAVELFAKYPDVLVDIMMAEELELQVPGEDDNPWWDGFITFCSFLVFGFVPLFGYVSFSEIEGITDEQLFGVASGLTAIALIFLGFLKSNFTAKHWTETATETLIFGSMTAAVAYLVAYATETAYNM
jgi:DNA damage-binding protein 1